jgi:hypothetical protein
LGPSFEFQSFTVKERDGDADFISARKITVQLALIPLLEKKVELKNLILDDATISLFRSADGTYNIDDLLKPGKDGVRVDFKKIRIHKGAILWRDMAGRKVPFSAALRNISLIADHLGRGQKGRLKLTADIPAASGAPTHLALSGALRLPPSEKSFLETVLDCNLEIKQAEIGRFWPVDTHELTILPRPPCWRDWSSPPRPPVCGLLISCMTIFNSLKWRQAMIHLN